MNGFLLSFLIVSLSLAVASPLRAAPEDEGADDLPDLETLWDWSDFARTEAAFREVLPRAREAGDPDYLGQLLTQIARTRGLQGDFDGAHALLDEADAVLTEECIVGRIRSLLERGRAYNSSGQKEKAYPMFLRAYVQAWKHGIEGYAVDAVHMLAIVAEPDDAIQWNELALEIAERSEDEKAIRWKASLYNNLGWTYHDKGEYAKALELWEKGLAFRASRGQNDLIAKWSVARALRSLGRLEEALERQRAIAKEYEAAEKPVSGFVLEEIGECLWALDRQDEARPYLAQAYEVLSKIDWMVSDEAERLASLKERGQVEER
ncbi:MAG: tetratricopeptide repeat protein [Planctomycetota bacterium]|jgi:tetratricopeptide (TPR) repeat protein